jgi:integrase
VMACIHQVSGGGWIVQFMPVERGRTRQRLPIGRVTKREAEAIKGHIERILETRKAGLALDEQSEKWLAKLPDRQRQRLIEKGVIENSGRRVRSTLSGFLDDYLRSRTDIEPGTRDLLRNARKWLEEFFGPDREMDSITPGEADEYRVWLGAEAGHAENTIRGLCKKARQFFRASLRQRAIRENPFAGMRRLTDLPSPKNRQFYLARTMAEKVLMACPNDEWRLIFALARYGGLRCPSELVRLTWSDIDWKKGQFVVHAKKTKRYEGKDTRTVPLFPELRPYLEACYRAKDRHPEKVIKRVRCTKNNLRTQMTRILKRAEIKVWPKLFQNLRSSRESKLIKVHGIEVACAWIGNTPAVAMKHYLQITDEDYEKALEAWRSLGREAG